MHVQGVATCIHYLISSVDIAVGWRTVFQFRKIPIKILIVLNRK